MYNIDNLIKVIEEANANIDGTIKKANAINQSINDINQKKYEKVKRWMLDIKEVSKKVGHATVLMKLPFIDWAYKYHNAAKIFIDQYGIIELGVYVMDAKYKPTRENWKKHGTWMQWVGCRRNYKEFISNDNLPYIENFCKGLIDNWDLYEKQCYENLKDWALEVMAEKAQEANDKYNEAVNKYQEV